MFILAAASLLVLLAVLVRVVGRRDHVLVIAARGLLWMAVILALTALFVSRASAQTLTISREAVLSAFPAPVEATSLDRPRTPRWATLLAVAGPLADGGTTCYAMAQSGPQARVAEGNGFFHHLFGSRVTCGEVLLFKSLQSALMGWATHMGGTGSKESRERVIGAAVIQGVLHLAVSGWNVSQAQKAKRLNR